MKYLVTLTLLFLSACHMTPPELLRLEGETTLDELAKDKQVDLAWLKRANPSLVGKKLEKGQRVLVPQTPDHFIEREKAKIEEILALSPKSVPAKSVTDGHVSDGPSKAALELGFAWPAKGKVLYPYGNRDGKFHPGVDIRLPDGESAVHAAAEGRVVYVGESIEGYGRTAILGHEGGWFSVYAQLSDISVEKGDDLSSGQTLGKVADGDKHYFHFELREKSQAKDPFKVLIAGDLMPMAKEAVTQESATDDKTPDDSQETLSVDNANMGGPKKTE